MPISPSTFDPLRRHVAVRMQRGVPILDVDWNERDDVRGFELRAYLKWFVGDGIPEGNDGFHVIGDGAVDDFVIGAGSAGSGVPGGGSGGGPESVMPVFPGMLPRRMWGLPAVAPQVGRCLVDGRDVIIGESLRFSEQALHASQPGASALADAWGVPVEPALPFPTGAADWVSIHLDVWERPVTAAEDPTLIGPVGRESCARIRREWVVRAGPPAGLPGHSYLEIARITRRADGVVAPDHVTDLRPRRLYAVPAALIEDTLGMTPREYRAGLHRPPVSLRAALNALLRGEIPGAPERMVMPGATVWQYLGRSGGIVDAEGNLITIWIHDAWSGNDQIYLGRMQGTAVSQGVQEIFPLTSGIHHRGPTATLLADGDLLVVYQAENGDVIYRRGRFPVFGPEQLVASTSALGGLGDGECLVGSAGGVVLFLFSAPGVGSDPSTVGWWFKRLRLSDGVWLDASPVSVPVPGLVSVNASNAIVDPAGRIWFATAFEDLRLVALDIATGAVVVSTATSPVPGATLPFLELGGDGLLYLTWGNFVVDELTVRAISTADGSVVRTATLPLPERPGGPTLLQETDGSISIYLSLVQPPTYPLQRVRLDPVSGTFGPPTTISPVPSAAPLPVRLGDGSTILFWSSEAPTPGVFATRYRQIVTAL
jgi:hypothetical protein